MNLTKSSIVRLGALALGIFVAGCGSSSPGTSSDPATAFAGGWTFASGSIDPMCSGVSITPFNLAGDTLIINRTDSTHVSTALSGNSIMCDVKFTVSGSTATAESGQTCAFPVTVAGTTMSVTVNITMWTLMVSGNNLTMSMSGSANALGLISCTPMGSGSATRTSDGGAAG